MIIYNKEWLDNLRVQEVAEKWFRKNFISKAQVSDIRQQFISGYKKTNIFLRIGMSLFTFILANSAIGLVMLFLSGAVSESFGIVLLVFGAVTWFILEKFVKEKKYFRNGIDDMLLYVAVSYLISGVAVLVFQATDSASLNSALLVSVIALPVLVFSAIRYADSFVSLISWFCLLFIVFILVNKTGSTGKAVLPFIVLIISFIVYKLAFKINKEELKFYWRNCLNTIEAASLVTLYAAGNYFVVRESSALLFDLSLQPGEDIPLAIIFYVLTFAIPVVYIITGLKNKDRISLQTGIILVALSILTYRYYYHFIEPETAMIIAGTILMLGSWYAIRKLSTPWKGITFKDTGDEPFSFIEAESLVIAQTFGQQAAKQNDVDYGGGKFGGGGAGGGF